MEAVLGGSHEKALDLAERALAIHPNSETVQRKCGWAFSHSGQSDRAIQHLETARRLSPTDPHRYFIEQGMVTAHFFARRYEECIACAQRVLAGTPSNTGARRFLAAALAHSGRAEEARRAVTELLERQPNASLTRSRKQAFGHPWMSELYVEGLRKAGLPE
jgi:adenylate cyclase